MSGSILPPRRSGFAAFSRPAASAPPAPAPDAVDEKAAAEAAGQLTLDAALEPAPKPAPPAAAPTPAPAKTPSPLAGIAPARRGFGSVVAGPVAGPGLSPAGPKTVLDDSDPNPNFGSSNDPVILQVGRSFWSDTEKGRTMCWAYAENGRELVKIKLGGPIELRDMEGSWLLVEGRFKADPRPPREPRGSRAQSNEPEYTGLVLNLDKHERAWPRFQAATKRALHDIFWPVLKPSGAFKAAEKRERLARLEAMADTGPDLLARMIDNAETLFSEAGFDGSEQVMLLIRWLDVTGPDRIMAALTGAGITEAIAKRIMNRWREKVHDALERNPYLVIGFGARFDQAEDLARQLQADTKGETRLLAFIHDMLISLERDGSTVLSLADAIERAITSDLEIDPSKIETITTIAEDDFGPDMPVSLINAADKDYFGLRHNVDDEAAIALWVSDRLNAFREYKHHNPETYRHNLETARRYAVEALTELMPGKPVDPVQAEAVAVAALEPVAILTGGPGTGKTTVSKALITVIERMNAGQITTVAPTGKAAQRLTQLSGRPSSTMHSLLGAVPDGDSSLFTAAPLDDGAVVMIDEASMSDTHIGAGLIRVMPANGKLILVGDDGQLEPVGAGQFLTDMIRACRGGISRVPLVRLTTVYRQDASGGIARAAAQIRAGQMPDLNVADSIFDITPGNWAMRTVDDSAITETIIAQSKALAESGCSLDQFVTIAPMRLGPGGTHEVNAALSKMFNPNGERFLRRGYDNIRGMPPRIGDRIMITKNFRDPETEITVVNGDVGTVLGIDGRNLMLQLDGHDQPVPLPPSAWSMLILGYAMTIHKSQGSQYSNVIMPMTTRHVRMLERRLIYTGWTRTIDRLLLVGDPRAMEYAIGNDRSHMRRTALAGLLEDTLIADHTMQPILELQAPPGEDIEPDDFEFDENPWRPDDHDEDDIDLGMPARGRRGLNRASVPVPTGPDDPAP